MGKTMLAIDACQAGFSIYFTTLDDMVRQLREAEVTGRFAEKLQTYLKPSSSSSTRWAFLPLSRPDANMAFQLVSRRYERGSVICTSNKAFAEWGSIFGDDVLAAAILDRLLHHCEVISINDPSYRLKDHSLSRRRWAPGVSISRRDLHVQTYGPRHFRLTADTRPILPGELGGDRLGPWPGWARA